MSRAREIADRDLAATELILDADNDTSITADTDDQIDIKVGGTDTVVVTPDVLEVKGSHPDLKLLDSDDNNYGGVFYNDGTITVGSDHGAQHSSSKARISVDGTARVTIDDGGDVDIETGDIFFSTAGKGINLGVTSNTNANTLDDYEEGTWTPTFYLGLSAQSWNQQYGHYIKVGQKVTVTFWLLGNGSGNTSDGNGMVIQGLPFNVGTSSGSHSYSRGHGVVNYTDIGSTVSTIVLYGHNGVDRVGLAYNSGRTSFTAGSNTTAANSAYVIGGFTYFTGSF